MPFSRYNVGSNDTLYWIGLLTFTGGEAWAVEPPAEIAFAYDSPGGSSDQKCRLLWNDFDHFF